MSLRSILSHLVLVASATTLLITAAQASDLEARCDQLIAYYDRYGSSRGEQSDGARNMTRISATIDCERGQYQQGIATMDDLLQRKKFTIPPAA
jgi:hypothetical protein